MRLYCLQYFVSLSFVRYTEYHTNRFRYMVAMDMKSRLSALQLTRDEKTILAGALTVCVLAWVALGLLLLDEYGWSRTAGMPPEPTRQGSSGGQGPHVVSSTSTATVPPDLPLPTPTWTPSVVPTLPLPTPTPKPPGAAPIPLSKDTTVIALLGTDEHRDAGAWRTDSIILAFVQPEAKRIALFSVPRDLWVYIPGNGYNRINIVDSLGERTDHPGGGLGLLSETIRYNLGVPVHHYLRIDFQGFVDIVDALGGVMIDVEKEFTDKFPDPDHENAWIMLTWNAGTQHMDGQTALRYSRSRMLTSDFDRSRRQQQVIKALWKQAFTVRNLGRAPALWKALDGAFETDLKLVDVLWLASRLQGIDPDDIQSKNLGFDTTRPWTTSQGAQVLLPQTEAIQQIIIDLIE